MADRGQEERAAAHPTAIAQGPPDPPAPPTDPTRLPLGLPVADLVGLRFSVIHLRLAGYGLLAVWAGEIIGLLRAPFIRAVGPRLHYISQALDVTPLLLVGIGLVAFQGGLQRSRLERLLLPTLLGLLPLLSLLHFLLAPASIANAMTLSAKQEEVSKAQLTSIERQLDRAGRVLRESTDLQELQRRLNAIPGVEMKSVASGNLKEARREVRESLINERRRLRSRIGINTSQARDQFARRAVQNAVVALLAGLMLAWMRFSAMQEMDLSSTYLAWVLVASPEAANARGIRELLIFQKRCLATSYAGLVQRLLRRTAADEAEEEAQLAQDLQAPLVVSEAPWEGSVSRPSLRPEHWRRTAGRFRGSEVLSPDIVPPEEEEEDFDEPLLTERELRRSERDRQRVRAALEQFALMVSDYYPTDGSEPKRPVRRPSERQLRKARQALERFAEHLQHQLSETEAGGAPDRSAEASGTGESPEAAAPLETGTVPPPPPVPDPPSLLVLLHWLRRNI